MGVYSLQERNNLDMSQIAIKNQQGGIMNRIKELIKRERNFIPAIEEHLRNTLDVDEYKVIIRPSGDRQVGIRKGKQRIIIDLRGVK